MMKMKMKKKTAIWELLAILTVFVLLGNCTAMPSAVLGELNATNPDSASSTEPNKNQKLAFSSYYQPQNISVNLTVPPYPLPLNFSNITNMVNITANFELNLDFRQ
jgi:flagellar basal body-associated protein FliL